MDCDTDFTHVDYIEMVNDTSGHDIDSWLAIDVAETDKLERVRTQSMDSSTGKRQLEPLQIPSVGVCDKKGRRFIYDESPKDNITEHQFSSTLVGTVSPSVTTKDASEEIEEDEEMKISFLNFKVGSIALFVPVDANKSTWMAFHANKPNRFLAQESLKVFSARYKLAEKTRILARIVYIEECKVPYDTADTSTGTTGIAVVGHHHATTNTIHYTTGTGTSSTSSSNSSTSNPYHLPPGSVYYECYVEAVSISKML